MSILTNRNIFTRAFLVPAMSAGTTISHGRLPSGAYELSMKSEEALNIAIKSDIEPIRQYLNPAPGEVYSVKNYHHNGYLYLVIFDNKHLKAIAYVFDANCLDWPSVGCIVNHGFCVEMNKVWDLYRNSEENPSFESNGGIGTLGEIRFVVNHVQRRKAFRTIKYEHGSFNLL